MTIIALLEHFSTFMTDLVRKIDVEMICYFMKADTVKNEQQISRIKKITCSQELDIYKKDVLLAGGVLDTGITLDFLTKHFSQDGPNLLKICYFIDKAEARKISIHCDYVGFVVDSPDSYSAVGYGLGHENKFGNLPCLGLYPLDNNEFGVFWRFI